MAKKKSKKKNIWLIPSAIALGSVMFIMGVAFLFVLLVGGFKTRYEALLNFSFETNANYNGEDYVRLGEQYSTSKYYIFFKENNRATSYTVVDCYDTYVTGTLFDEVEQSLYYKDVLEKLDEKFENKQDVLIYRVYNVKILPEPYDATELDFDLKIENQNEQAVAVFAQYAPKMEGKEIITDKKGYPILESLPYGFSTQKQVYAKKPIEILVKQEILDVSARSDEQYYIERIFEELTKSVNVYIKNKRWGQVTAEDDAIQSKFDLSPFEAIIGDSTNTNYNNLYSFRILRDNFRHFDDAARTDHIYKASQEIYKLMFPEAGDAIGATEGNKNVLESNLGLINCAGNFKLTATTSDFENEATPNGAKEHKTLDVNCKIDTAIIKADLTSDIAEEDIYVNSTFKVNLTNYFPTNSDKPYDIGNKKVVKYFSNNTDFATVDSNGNVTVKKESDFKIYAYVASLYEYEELLNQTEIKTFGDLLYNLEGKVVWASKEFSVVPVKVQKLETNGSINVGINNTSTFTLEPDSLDDIELRVYPDEKAVLDADPRYMYAGMLQRLEKVTFKIKVKDNSFGTKTDGASYVHIFDPELIAKQDGLFNGVKITIKALNELELTNKELVLECSLTEGLETFIADIPIKISSKVLYEIDSSLNAKPSTITYQHGRDDALWKAYYTGTQVKTEIGTNPNELLQDYINLNEQAQESGFITFLEGTDYKYLKFFVEANQTSFLTTQTKILYNGTYYEEIAGLYLLQIGTSEYAVGLKEGLLYPISATTSNKSVTIYPMLVKTEIVNGVEQPVYVSAESERLYYYNGKYYTTYQDETTDNSADFEYVCDIYTGAVYSFGADGLQDASGKELAVIDGKYRYLYSGEVYTDKIGNNAKYYTAGDNTELFAYTIDETTYLFLNKQILSSAQTNGSEYRIGGKRLYTLDGKGGNYYSLSAKDVSLIDAQTKTHYTNTGKQLNYALQSKGDDSKLYYKVFIYDQSATEKYKLEYDKIFYLEGGKTYYYDVGKNEITSNLDPTQNREQINLTAISAGYFKIKEDNGTYFAQRLNITDQDVCVYYDSNITDTEPGIYCAVKELADDKKYATDEINNIYEISTGTLSVTDSGLYYYNGSELTAFSKADTNAFYLRSFVRDDTNGTYTTKMATEVDTTETNPTYYSETGNILNFEEEQPILVEAIAGSIYATQAYTGNVYQEYAGGDVYFDTKNTNLKYDNSGDIVFTEGSAPNITYAKFSNLYAIIDPTAVVEDPPSAPEYVLDTTNTPNENAVLNDGTPVKLYKVTRSGLYVITYNDSNAVFEIDLISENTNFIFKLKGDVEPVFSKIFALKAGEYYAVYEESGNIVVTNDYYILKQDYLFITNEDETISYIVKNNNNIEVGCNQATQQYYQMEAYVGNVYLNANTVKEIYLKISGGYALVEDEVYSAHNTYYGVEASPAFEVTVAGWYYNTTTPKEPDPSTGSGAVADYYVYRVDTDDSKLGNNVYGYNSEVYSDSACETEVSDLTTLVSGGTYYVKSIDKDGNEIAKAVTVKYLETGFYSIYTLNPTIDYVTIEIDKTEKYRLHYLTSGNYEYVNENFMATDSEDFLIVSEEDKGWYYYNEEAEEAEKYDYSAVSGLRVREYKKLTLITESGWYYYNSDTKQYEKVEEDAQVLGKQELRAGDFVNSCRYYENSEEIYKIYKYTGTITITTFHDNTGKKLIEADGKYINISDASFENQTIAYELDAQIYYESIYNKVTVHFEIEADGYYTISVANGVYTPSKVAAGTEGSIELTVGHYIVDKGSYKKVDFEIEEDGYYTVTNNVPTAANEGDDGSCYLTKGYYKVNTQNEFVNSYTENQYTVKDGELNNKPYKAGLRTIIVSKFYDVTETDEVYYQVYNKVTVHFEIEEDGSYTISQAGGVYTPTKVDAGTEGSVELTVGHYIVDKGTYKKVDFEIETDGYYTVTNNVPTPVAEGTENSYYLTSGYYIEDTGLFYTDERYTNRFFGKVLMIAYKDGTSQILNYNQYLALENKDEYIVKFYKANVKEVVYKYENWCYLTKEYFIKEMLETDDNKTGKFVFDVLNRIDEQNINKSFAYSLSGSYTPILDSYEELSDLTLDSALYFKFGNGSTVVNGYTFKELIDNGWFEVRCEDVYGNAIAGAVKVEDNYVEVKLATATTYVIKFLISPDLYTTNTDAFISLLTVRATATYATLTSLSATTDVEEIGVHSASASGFEYYVNDVSVKDEEQKIIINVDASPTGFLAGKQVRVTTNRSDVIQLTDENGNVTETFVVANDNTILLKYNILKLDQASDTDIEFTVSYSYGNTTISGKFSITLNKYAANLYLDEDKESAVPETGFANEIELQKDKKTIELYSEIDFSLLTPQITAVEIYSTKTDRLLRVLGNTPNFTVKLEEDGVKDVLKLTITGWQEINFDEYLIVKVKLVTKEGSPEFEFANTVNLKLITNTQVYLYLEGQTYYGVPSDNLLQKNETNSGNGAVHRFKEENGLLTEVSVEEFGTAPNTTYYYTTSEFSKIKYNSDDNEWQTWDEASSEFKDNNTFTPSRLFIQKDTYFVEAGNQTITYLADKKLYLADVGNKKLGYGEDGVQTYSITQGKEGDLLGYIQVICDGEGVGDITEGELTNNEFAASGCKVKLTTETYNPVNPVQKTVNGYSFLGTEREVLSEKTIKNLTNFVNPVLTGKFVGEGISIAEIAYSFKFNTTLAQGFELDDVHNCLYYSYTTEDFQNVKFLVAKIDGNYITLFNISDVGLTQDYLPFGIDATVTGLKIIETGVADPLFNNNTLSIKCNLNMAIVKQGSYGSNLNSDDGLEFEALPDGTLNYYVSATRRDDKFFNIKDEDEDENEDITSLLTGKTIYQKKADGSYEAVTDFENGKTYYYSLMIDSVNCLNKKLYDDIGDEVSSSFIGKKLFKLTDGVYKLVTNDFELNNTITNGTYYYLIEDVQTYIFAFGEIDMVYTPSVVAS